MALVAYDYSGSENEDEEEDREDQNDSAVILTKNSNTTTAVSDNLSTEGKNEVKEQIEESSIGKLLPKTKEQTINVVEDKLEDFVPKYVPPPKPVKEKVKITIPSLSQFQDDEDDDKSDGPASKKVKTTPKGSGLLSVLPPVKGSPLTTKSFVPKVVAQKTATNLKPSTSSLVPDAVKRKAELMKKAYVNKKIAESKSKSKEDNDEDEDDDETPETFDAELWEKVCGRPKPKQTIVNEPEEDIQPTSTIDLAPEPIKPYDGLDNQAFKELVGKNKRPHLNYKLIDINEEEIVADKDVWITKSLTDPDQVPPKTVEDPVDPTRRKKHHITYLAQQAKANEQELQSQWSANKYTRNQTRAKYGF